MESLLTVQCVAKLFNCSKSCIYNLTQKGKIPSAKIGGLIRFRLEDIEKIIQKSMVSSGLKHKVLPSAQSSKHKIKQIIDTCIENSKKFPYNSEQIRGTAAIKPGKKGA